MPAALNKYEVIEERELENEAWGITWEKSQEGEDGAQTTGGEKETATLRRKEQMQQQRKKQLEEALTESLTAIFLSSGWSLVAVN